MPIDRVLKAVQDYLDEEAGILETAPSHVSRDALRRDLERAGGRLRAEIAAYEQWRARERTFRRLLVGIDRSEQSGWAAEVAARLARDESARVALVHVVAEALAVGGEFAFVDPELRDAHRHDGEDLLRRATGRFPPGVAVETFLHEGDPSHQLVAIAREWHADLIVVGTHGRGALRRLLLGGTAEWVVRHAHCPVLTVSHPATELLIEQLAAEAAEAQPVPSMAAPAPSVH